MISRAVLAILLVALAGPAIAEDCPISEAAIDKAGGFANSVSVALKAAPSCAAAFKIFAACQLGSSGDNALGDIVQSKCEPLFMDKASAGTKRAYKKALHRCDEIALKNSGTMYQGLAAVCRAEQSRNFTVKR